MSKTFDLSTLNLSAGTHSITVKARASGYADSPASNSVSYVVAGDTVQVSGTWVFNDKLNLPSTRINQGVNFTSYFKIQNGILRECRGMTVGVTQSYEGTFYKHLWYQAYDPDTSQTHSGSVYSGRTGEWAWNGEPKTITFDGVQTVSKEFYEWFVANAVRQTITFTIDGTQYTALSGMTWGEWVESEYNTAGYYVKNSAIHLDDDTYVAKTAFVSSTDKIEASQVYRLETLGGSYD